MNSIQELLVKGKKLLEENNLPEIEARLILEKILSLPQEKIFTQVEKSVSPKHEKEYFRLISDRIKGVPLQYLLGFQWFWSLKFKVNLNVSIPRPETELAVEKTLEICSQEEKIIIVDLGTGCGNIALSLAKALPQSQVIAIDISKEALKIAKINAKNHKLRNVKFFRGDLFSPLEKLNLIQKINVIVSNPPYVSEREWQKLPAEIQEYEPKQALVSGESGLEIIKRIIEESPKYLKAKGFLILEIGDKQKNRVKNLFNTQWQDIEIFSDLNDLPRVVKAQIIKPNNLE
ncbi:MAG: peptide chain release factor N(5)-glutamine methyltransferase [Candidatus Aminicenantia bacterium]